MHLQDWLSVVRKDNCFGGGGSPSGKICAFAGAIRDTTPGLETNLAEFATDFKMRLQFGKELATCLAIGEAIVVAVFFNISEFSLLSPSHPLCWNLTDLEINLQFR